MKADVTGALVEVRGRVQGVFFRAETRETASRLGLNGWVMNRTDGSVLAFFEGEKGAVERAVEWCGKGPPAAVVESVEVEWRRPEGITGFEVRYR